MQTKVVDRCRINAFPESGKGFCCRALVLERYGLPAHFGWKAVVGILIASDRLRALLAEADIAAYFLVAETVPQTEGLLDLHGDFRRLYGMSGAFLSLIRPDDHIGLFQQPINVRPLRDYLTQLASSTSSAATISRV